MGKPTPRDFGVLLLSCDKYADLWPVTLRQFRKYFQNRAYQIYFGSNELPVNDVGVTSVLSGADSNWSSSYIRILQQIPCRKLFILLEDLLVTSPIDPVNFDECVRFMLMHDAKHIKYWPTPKPDKDTDHNFFKEYSCGAPYRATVCGFWDREYLLHLLLPGETPWNFEIMGSYRTSYSKGFYATANPLFEFVNVVEKGGWTRESLIWAKENGISFNLTLRPVLIGQKKITSYIQKMYFNLMLKVPWKIRLGLMRKLRKVLISY